MLTDRWGWLVEQSSDLMAVLDLDLTVVDVAEDGARRMGFTPEELVGQSLYDLAHPADRESVLEAHAGMGSPGETATVGHRLLTDGAWRWFETSLTLGQDQQEQAVLAVARRLDDRHELTRLLEQDRDLTARLAEVEDLRAGLVSAVSHELRTPLTTVVGMAQTLAEHGQTLPADRRRELADRLASAVGRLADRVLDAINAGQLLTGALRSSRRPVRLQPLAREVATSAVARDRSIEIEISPDVTVIADPDHLRDMLRVLLGNAHKHSPPGLPVTVRVESSGDETLVIVEDRGPGVPPHVRDVIFEPFGRWQPTQAQPGIGLGLYLVAALAHLHGGRAWVEDRPGGGASFRVAVPRHGTLAGSLATAAPTQAQPTGPARPVPRRLGRVLLVDDDQAILDANRLALELEGFDVSIARSGADALVLAADTGPTVVVLDVMMPDMDGWEVAERLRATSDRLPIVFCTALDGAIAHRRARQLDAHAFLSKPFDTADLVAVVSEAAVAADRAV